MSEENEPSFPAYSVARLFNEATSVEREIIEHLCNPALGWRYASREEIC